MTVSESSPSPAGSSDQFDGVRVRVHPGLCEGWGNCHRFASAVYPLDAEGRVDLHLLQVPSALTETARLGADVCPEQAITIIDGPVTRS